MAAQRRASDIAPSPQADATRMAAQDEDDAMAFSWQARVSGHAFCVWQGIRKLTLVVWVRKGLLCVFVPGRGKKVAPRIPSCLPASFPTRAGPGCRPQGRGPSLFHGQAGDADHREPVACAVFRTDCHSPVAFLWGTGGWGGLLL